MKFHLEDIVDNAKRGSPSLGVYRSYNKWVSQEIDYPDHWFNFVHGNAPATGKQGSYVCLSRAGFQALEPDLYTAFQQANNSSCPTWDVYKQLVESQFADLEKVRQRLIKKHEKILEELNNFTV